MRLILRICSMHAIYNILHVSGGCWESGCTNVILPLGLMQRNVLTDQDTDPNTTEVEAIQKLVNLWKFCEPISRRAELPLKLRHSYGHDWHHISAVLKHDCHVHHGVGTT